LKLVVALALVAAVIAGEAPVGGDMKHRHRGNHSSGERGGHRGMNKGPCNFMEQASKIMQCYTAKCANKAERDDQKMEIMGRCQAEKSDNAPAAPSPNATDRKSMKPQKQSRACKYCGPNTFDDLSEKSQCQIGCHIETFKLTGDDGKTINEPNYESMARGLAKPNNTQVADELAKGVKSCFASAIADQANKNANDQAYSMHKCFLPIVGKNCKKCSDDPNAKLEDDQ